MSNIIKSSYGQWDRAEMLPFVTNDPKSSLEVACREGRFSQLLTTHFGGVTTWGVDPDPSIKVDVAKNNLDNFIHGYFPQCIEDMPEKKFDLIVFNDVLEHLYDPWEALEKAHEILTDDGVVIISLPNIRHKKIVKDLIFKNEFKYESSGILDISHVRFFTTKSMLRLFDESNFEVLKMAPLEGKTGLIKKLRRKIINTLTLGKFESLYYSQYGFTLKKA